MDIEHNTMYKLFAATRASEADSDPRLAFADALLTPKPYGGMLGLMAAMTLREYRDATTQAVCRHGCGRACAERRIYAHSVMNALVDGARMQPPSPQRATPEQLRQHRLELAFALWCTVEVHRWHYRNGVEAYQHLTERAQGTLYSISSHERGSDWRAVQLAVEAQIEEMRHNRSGNNARHAHLVDEMFRVAHPVLPGRVLWLVQWYSENYEPDLARQLLQRPLPDGVHEMPHESEVRAGYMIGMGLTRSVS